MCLPICLNHKKFHNREKCNKLALTVTGNCHKKIPLGVGGLTTWVLILNQLLISYKVHQGFIFPRFHLDGLELRNSKVEQSAAEHAHKQPFVIGSKEELEASLLRKGAVLCISWFEVSAVASASSSWTKLTINTTKRVIKFIE
ncbi:uncharacterized protein LOC114265336 isoform X3 [Camellia sinensis]|uniref:uncharacterized protein LOC114265336 isoform X3 n=1 Tax=Camellia sinensis TaxID=4442 RepID=UPI001036A94D|nr:uncharacterized protein LOC114265336 isoform X3 [Camellia sinensis]